MYYSIIILLINQNTKFTIHTSIQEDSKIIHLNVLFANKLIIIQIVNSVLHGLQSMKLMVINQMVSQYHVFSAVNKFKCQNVLTVNHQGELIKLLNIILSFFYFNFYIYMYNHINKQKYLKLNTSHCNFNNEMKNYCNQCSKYYFKQICQICREVSTFNQKESLIKQKCQNKKCGKGAILKTGKIQNQQVIIGQFIKANDIQQVQPQKQQQTSKFLENLDLLDFGNHNENDKLNQNITNLLDADQHLDQPLQDECLITKCQKCYNSTDVIITTPCGHKVTCYQCLENQLNCISCGEPITNRIINTFNRDFQQEIKERILIYRQE